MFLINHSVLVMFCNYLFFVFLMVFRILIKFLYYFISRIFNFIKVIFLINYSRICVLHLVMSCLIMILQLSIVSF